MNPLFQKKKIEYFMIAVLCVIFLYLIISLYFTNHFYFNTKINGLDVSLKSCKNTEKLIKSYLKDYKLNLVERNGEIEEITSQEIGMDYNIEQCCPDIYDLQPSLLWISSLFRPQSYYVKDLYHYNTDKLRDTIDELHCLNKAMMKPRNVTFSFSNGSYKAKEAIYGDFILQENLNKVIEQAILHGETVLDLEKMHCYEEPKYTLDSEKTTKTMKVLNTYVATNITYLFGDKSEILDGNTINKWLVVDEDLEIQLSNYAVTNYVKYLSKKYDTVGIVRSFKTTVGKEVEVVGGLYGWKIDQEAEVQALLDTIEFGKVIKKEPSYIQKALSRDYDIGNTYVEINITRQHLWFYKDGALIIQGPVVTGNPNKGYSTVVGSNMLTYKQKDVTLVGPSYEAKVTYWMPFYGNIGIHDASWRHSFGGDIYKRRGSHGCVNAPVYLAKTIFEHIEEGTPIISYEE